MSPTWLHPNKPQKGRNKQDKEAPKVLAHTISGKQSMAMMQEPRSKHTSNVLQGKAWI